MNRFAEITEFPRKIASRELAAFFSSPTAYIVTAVFLVFTGFFFFKDFFYFNQADMRNFFQLLPLMFSFIAPAITMGLFTQERNSGTIELLLTLPVTSRDAVLGKFAAAVVFMAAMMVPTFFYAATVFVLGSPDPGAIVCAYAGTIFLSATYVSIGLMTSALAKNQIVAFITAWAISFFFWLADKVTIFLPSAFSFVERLGTDHRFSSMSRGVIEFRDILYFVSVSAIFLMITERIMEEKR